MNIGFFLALAAGFVWSVGNISHKLLASRLIRSPFFMLLVFSTVAGVVGLGVFVFEPVIITGGDLMLALGAAIVYLCAVFFYFQAMKIEEASRVVPLFAIGTVLIIVMSAIFLKEVFSVLQYIGIFLVISGSVIISTQGRFFSFLKSRLLGWMSLSGLCFAVNTLLVKKILETHSFVQTFSHLSLIKGLIGLVVAIILFPRVRDAFKQISRKHIFINVATDLMNIGAEFIYTIALSLWYLTLVETVASLQYVFIFILTILLSRFRPQLVMERITARIVAQKSFSIILIVIGIYLIS